MEYSQALVILIAELPDLERNATSVSVRSTESDIF